jgi:hypothetical protein
MAELPPSSLVVRPTVTPHLGSHQASARVMAPAAPGGLDPAALLVDLVAYWTLDEASGMRADATGRGHTLSETNGTISAATGRVDQAAAFGTANRWLQATSTADLQVGDADYTLAAWIYLDATGYEVLAKRQGSDQEYLLAGYSPFVLLVRGGDGQDYELHAAGTLSPATWYFVVWWHDASTDTLNIQVNDGAVSSLGHTVGLAATAAPLTLGGDPGWGGTLPGRLDEVGVWRRVLTSAERTYLYHGGAGRPYPFP